MTQSITEKRLGSFPDTIKELHQAGIITEEELSRVMMDLILSEAVELLEPLVQKLSDDKC